MCCITNIISDNRHIITCNIFIYLYLNYIKKNIMNIPKKRHNIEQLDNAAEMLKAIAHPMRMAILDLLEDGRMLTVTEIHEVLNIEQSSTSHHLGILKNKGVLASKRKGKNTFYYLKNTKFSNILEFVNSSS
jgi:DNA-binding transcriptional ArsR family regulator